MGKVKSWAWDCAEEQSDDIINSYVKGDIDIKKAKEKMSNVENLDLVGIDEYNVDEVLDDALSGTYVNKEGVLQ